MNTTNEKIGHLIYQIRQERGLTQAEFARRLGTSQSAVNRIEKGRQNLSLDTVGRISDVLNKQIITLGGGAVVDKVENLARDRAKELFGCTHANVQAHSGCPANFAAYYALLDPGDTLMGLALTHGGHMTSRSSRPKN